MPADRRPDGSPQGLVIFDCDGVLVDSEPISVAVLLEIIREAGAELSEDTAYERFLGRSMASIGEILQAELDFSMTDELLSAMRLRLYEQFRRELKPVPGIKDAIPRIALPFCVASSSQPERIRLSLKITGLLESFEPHIYSSTMVERGKPAPDLFLHAARDMGARPRDCVVIEDSPAGVEAAKSADMTVFAFLGGSHAGAGNLRQRIERLAPDRIFDDMRELPELLDGAARRRTTT